MGGPARSRSSPASAASGASTGWSSPAGVITSTSPRRCATPATRPAGATLLERHGLGCWAIGNHLVGQAVCDPIDERHQGVLSPEIWGDGDPEGVRQRAAEAMKDTARAAAQLGVDVVTGFTGSPIWHMLYSFPPNDFDDDRARLPGVRRALGADHRRVRGRGRAVRARGPPDRDRLRLRDDAQGAGGDRRPARASGSTSTRATSSTSSWTRRPSSPSSATRSSTPTSRTRSGTSTAARRSSAGT